MAEDDDIGCPILEDLVSVHHLIHEAVAKLDAGCDPQIEDLSKALNVVLTGRDRNLCALALLRVLLRLADDEPVGMPKWKM